MPQFCSNFHYHWDGLGGLGRFWVGGEASTFGGWGEGRWLWGWHSTKKSMSRGWHLCFCFLLPIFSAGKWRTSIPGTQRRNTSHIASWESLAIISTFAFFVVSTSTITRVNFPVPAAISKSFVDSLLFDGKTPTLLSRNSTDSLEYSGLPLSYKDISVVNFRTSLLVSAMLNRVLDRVSRGTWNWDEWKIRNLKLET